MLGSERHESRRIDNQLRGRSGRQGDPGESRFFLSLEDELMRLFATGAMSWVMDRALPDDVPIEARMVTRAIERAQNTVEQKNAEVRKDVLKYDEVMNEQRKVIYERRMQLIDGEDLREPDDRADRGEDRPRSSPTAARPTSPRSGTSSSSVDRGRRSTTRELHRRRPGAGRRALEQLTESVVAEARRVLRERGRRRSAATRPPATSNAR